MENLSIGIKIANTEINTEQSFPWVSFIFKKVAYIRYLFRLYSRLCDCMALLEYLPPLLGNATVDRCENL